MRKNLLFVMIATTASLFFISCKKDEPTYSANLVNKFVYDGLSQYYYWSDEMTSKKPGSTDKDPSAYFDRILSTSDRFSWITNDVQGLLADFAGTPVSFGFNLTFAESPTSTSEYYALIEYVFPNTPASKANLKRMELIGKINGNPITESNYEALYGSSAVTLTIYKITSSGLVQDRVVNVTPAEINTDPVLCDSIYEVPGHKIGYLFYTDFIANYNSSLYNTFSKFKQAGVTDLILDLRYNHGGALTAATYLSSMIAPASVVQTKPVFTKMSYNSYLNSMFDQNGWSRSENLGVYETGEQNPMNANLNLSKVYIIATSDSYSASELTTFCLKSYMDVVHIGGNTGGKYVASWTIHPYNENLGVPVYDSTSIKTSDKNILKNWAMQPIVAKYTNKSGVDFSNPGYLVPDYSLQEGGGYFSNWKQIGDTTDTYLAQAIWLIKGNSGIKPVPVMYKSKSMIQNIRELPNVKDVKKSGVILNNLRFTKEQLKKIRIALQYQ